MDVGRLFIGLALPDELKHGLAELQRGLKRKVPGSCSWTRPGAWHVTLAFLGDTPMDKLADLETALAGVAWRAFALRPGGCGFFPSMSRPRVLWVGAAEGGGAMAALARDIGQALEPLGFTPDPRPFTAHLTVARIKHGPPGADWRKAMDEVNRARWPKTLIDRFVLWRSYLGGEAGGGGRPGPLHVPLREFGASG
jgi:2'-5' RNA ligase